MWVKKSISLDCEIDPDFWGSDVYADLESDIPLDNVRTTESAASREQLSDRYNKDSTEKQKVKSANANNDEICFSVVEPDNLASVASPLRAMLFSLPQVHLLTIIGHPTLLIKFQEIFFFRVFDFCYFALGIY